MSTNCNDEITTSSQLYDKIIDNDTMGEDYEKRIKEEYKQKYINLENDNPKWYIYKLDLSVFSINDIKEKYNRTVSLIKEYEMKQRKLDMLI